MWSRKEVEEGQREELVGGARGRMNGACQLRELPVSAVIYCLRAQYLLRSGLQSLT